MKNSRIEWTHHTFNPWIGCTKVSPGCANCYAAAEDCRRKWTPAGWGRGKPRRRTSANYWRQPLRWNREATGGPRPRVFCASLADWLDDEVRLDWLADLLDVIRQTPHLDWMLLTKRPENWRERVRATLGLKAWRDYPLYRWTEDWLEGKPPANVWVGTSVEDQVRADERIPALLAIPAAVRFLSCEPLLGPLNLVAHVEQRGAHFKTLTGTGWLGGDEPSPIQLVICGGESGRGARPMHPDWVRGLRDQCDIAGVAFFFKQWGHWKPHSGWDIWKRVPASIWVHRRTAETWQSRRRGAVVGDCETEQQANDWDLMMGAGKNLSGRLLDGREWNQMPAAAPFTAEVQ